MKNIKFIIILVGLIGSNNVMANESTSSVKITSLVNWIGTINNPNESVFVKTNEAQLTNPANCTKLDAYHVDAASKISRSMLLTAYTAKTNVVLNIFSGGCSADNRPVIITVSLIE